MNNSTASNPATLSHVFNLMTRTALLPVLIFALTNQFALAGSATWNVNPTSGDWDTAANWTPATVPNGPSDTATFASSSVTGLSLSAATEVNGIVLNSSASAFTITVSHPFLLTISGVGITNSSAVAQNFLVTGDATGQGFLIFANSATAGSGTVFTNNGGAGSGTFGGVTSFSSTATAGSATLIANGGSGGGTGGAIFFNDDSSGGTSRVEVFGNGNLDISAHNAPGVTIGSLEGDGLVHLGSNNLTMGTNVTKTTFSGLIDGSGSITMDGPTDFTVRSANTYLGGTIITLGAIIANNRTGSATGPGPVQVNKDTLGGTGIIAGAVTIGSGTGPKAYLEPSVATKHATLTIQSSLTINSDGSYNYKVNTTTVAADEVIANGVTIQHGAHFHLNTVANKRLPIGTVFTAISNTSATPINGTFTNLPDGSTLTAGRNNYQASYEGGDGNDLTLTVVP